MFYKYSFKLFSPHFAFTVLIYKYTHIFVYELIYFNYINSYINECKHTSWCWCYLANTMYQNRQIQPPQAKQCQLLNLITNCDLIMGWISHCRKSDSVMSHYNNNTDTLSISNSQTKAVTLVSSWLDYKRRQEVLRHCVRMVLMEVEDAEGEEREEGMRRRKIRRRRRCTPAWLDFRFDLLGKEN